MCTLLGVPLWLATSQGCLPRPVGVLQAFAGEELALAGLARLYKEEEEEEGEEVEVHCAAGDDLEGVCVDARVGVEFRWCVYRGARSWEKENKWWGRKMRRNKRHRQA
jgi:hypothetical protein